MKRAIVLLAAMCMLVPLLAGNAVAGSDYDQTYDAHPIHIAAYAIHPVGVALEWLIFRPIHAMVSFPYVSYVFGHRINDGINHQEYSK